MESPRPGWTTLLGTAYARVMGLVVGLAFIGAGLISIAAVIQQAHDGSASLQWPTAVGVVEQASLDRGWTHGGERTYSPHIVYRYAVMGREYSSDQITVGSSGTPRPGETGRQLAESILAQYPVGASIPVYYDPGAPARAVLEPGSVRGNGGTLGLAISVLMTLLGILVLLVCARAPA